jgi:hypothetical protein
MFIIKLVMVAIGINSALVMDSLGLNRTACRRPGMRDNNYKYRPAYLDGDKINAGDFFIGSASALGIDREAEQDVMVSDRDGYYPSTCTCCHVLLRRLVVFKNRILSRMQFGDIARASNVPGGEQWRAQCE